MSNTISAMSPNPDPYGHWPPQVSTADYNDELAVKAYLNHFQTYRWYPYDSLKTDFENRCLNLGGEYRKTQSIKKAHQERSINDTSMNEVIQRVEREWNSNANADVRAALGNECDPEKMRVLLNAFRESVYKRIDQLMQISDGIPINRCPACNRVARTPVARQCMWCKHDWH